WGANFSAQLGDGTWNDSPVPKRIEALSDVIAIASGRYHALALKADGTFWAWGDNGSGQLGLGHYNYPTEPVQVPLANVVRMAGGYDHSAAIDAEGRLWTWGGYRD